MAKQNKEKEPMLRMSKRDDLPWYKAWGIRGLAIVLALLACAIVTTALTGDNPISVYAAMITGSFGTARKTWITFQSLSILLIISLGLTPAFKMKFWNIGGEGQVLIGGLAASACMIYLKDVPSPVLMLIMLIAGIVAGGIWGLIPAFFKAKWNTNETLCTLMMNYIATQIVAFFIIVWEVPKGSGTVGIINQDTKNGWFPDIFGSKYMLICFVALIITVIMYVYLKYSKQGYEISVVGESEQTARYVGIKVENVILRTMFLSGAICGLVGVLMVGGVNHTISTTFVNGRGFTAVMVSWLAKFNPFGMIATSFLIAFLGRGANEISTKFELNQSFGDILTGIILFFIIGCEFFITYKVNLRKKSAKEEN